MAMGNGVGIGQWLGAVAMGVVGLQMVRKYMGMRALKRRIHKSEQRRKSTDAPT
ncbi:MAG: hypothetical protein ACOYOB_13745 [Myxococcota bacterium]